MVGIRKYLMAKIYKHCWDLRRFEHVQHLPVVSRLAVGALARSEAVPWTMGRKCRFVRTPSPRKRRRRTWPRPREGEPRRRPGACWSEQSDARVAQQRVLTQQGPLRGNDHPLLIIFIFFF